MEKKEKLDFIKKVLKLFSQTELKAVLILCTHAKRHHGRRVISYI